MKIQYETGVKEFEVDGGTIRFNPADTVFVEKLYNCFEKLSKRQEQGEEENAELARDGEKLWAAVHAKEAEMRGYIDEVFGEGASAKIFPEIGLYAIADGLPVWANFLLAVLDIVDASVTDGQKRATPRAEALMKKYGKYIKK